YTRLYYPVASFTVKKRSLFAALCAVGDEMRARWKQDGNFLLARRASYFWDKLKEVPARALRRWQQDRLAHRGLPLGDLLEMATLSDAQLDSARVADGVSHCWDIPEWQIVSQQPGRTTARFLALLSPVQLQRALQPDGMPLEGLAPQQLRLLADTGGLPDPNLQPLAGARLLAQYIPAGRYFWTEEGTAGAAFTSVPLDPDEVARAAVRPVVAAATPEQALAEARRIFPAAIPGAIRATRGILVLMIRLANG